MPDSAGNSTLIGSRIVLEPLRVEHTQEMSLILSDRALYRFTGGQPPSESELSARYRAQVNGRSPDGSQRWLNWIVRLRETGAAAGYVQATVTGTPDHERAELAWVIGSQYQRHGYAREAVQMMLTSLQADGVGRVEAHIHPDHDASNAIARHVGLSPTAVMVDGERRWERTL